MGTLKEWIFTTDHKRVGVLYLIGSLAAFAVAGIMALLMRWELTTIGPTLTANPTTYNVWLYAHGAVMILGFQIPALTGFFANYCIPLMIGAKDVAFPRLNAFSVWLFYVGIILAILTFFIPDSPDIMWTAYPPYSTITSGNTALYTFTVLILGFASILGGVNFLTTVAYMRAPGMTWNKLNIFVWCTLAAFVLQLIFVPVLGTAVTLISFDKYLGTGFFDPAKGGDVLIYQNLFWFYSHPAVYVIFLPFIGVVYEIVATFARNRVFNYKMVVYGGIFGIVGLSGVVWVHHLYVTGMADWIRIGQMVTTLLISVPVGFTVIGLVGTLYKGSISFETPMLYALGVLFLFLIGGLTGIPLAITSLTLHLSDTYYVVGHFHYVMAVAGTFSIFGGVYYWFPKITGRMYSEAIGKLGFWITFAGTNIVFWIMMDIGVKGMPRRYYDYAHFPQFENAHQWMTGGAALIGLGFALAVLNWIVGAIRGAKAPDNPWGSQSLEWSTQTPPPPGNWKDVPTIREEWDPYAYARP
ncbi:MAG: cytochrome c oxidase subunit 1 [Candidatus Desulfobacillus denitrificans]|jgi:cytochrome c oxidase subunit 1|uniref:Cytochrome c oxidase subunit 1 n=1 Tax=Candidatus Desulfobacillus denitrificans TaxID=2608985 RepID=A0A809QVY8_9PROT|nr:cbb3-type cytochrome c oxidase subunit I [Burkholderiales bacterium]BBO19593.1 cytochrome c oxidase subunit 1 [Candidatus Desulfobacillus denitrificans]GIK45729.1 MAG: cytochrome c oxidase subunit 1 [Betaproteobacteria bacterium]GJQ56155.1 MAG: cytochrome c oxidase subunit 1 [Rhodocyclaceae bacterium]